MFKWYNSLRILVTASIAQLVARPSPTDSVVGDRMFEAPSRHQFFRVINPTASSLLLLGRGLNHKMIRVPFQNMRIPML